MPKPLFEDFVLDVMESTLVVMEKIENQLMRSRGSRLLTASVVKEINENVGKLKPNVVLAAHIGDASSNRETEGSWDSGFPPRP